MENVTVFEFSIYYLLCLLVNVLENKAEGFMAL